MFDFNVSRKILIHFLNIKNKDCECQVFFQKFSEQISHIASRGHKRKKNMKKMKVILKNPQNSGSSLRETPESRLLRRME
jgi:hypothetical protein